MRFRQWMMVLAVLVVGAAGRATASPPTVPSITGLVNNVVQVWSNGVSVTNYAVKGDYQVRWSGSTHTNGINVYLLQEAGTPSFGAGTVTSVLGGAFLTNRSFQYFLKPSGTNFYRIKAEAFTGETSTWSSVSNKIVQMAQPVPPSVPQIAKVYKNVKQDVWKNGALVTGYVHQADFAVCVSTSASGEGVNFYEIQETTNPTNFLLGGNVSVYLPHYPDTNSFVPGTSTLNTNPVQQFFTKPNGTYYYRVRAKDRNGFTSQWNVAAVTNWGAYSNVTVAMTNYPPSAPVVRSISNNVRQGVWLNGAFVSNYLHQGDFVVNVSTSTSGAGVNFYEIQESTAATNFILGNNVSVYLPHYPDPTSFIPGTTNQFPNPAYQFFLKTNATYSYRVRAVDINGFTSGWSVAAVTNWPAYSNKQVNIAGTVPPTVPGITKVERNVRQAVWLNGVLNTNYLHAADYAIHLSIAASGPGVNAYEIQEATAPSNFAAGLGTEFSLPHYPNTNEFLPGTSTLYTNPVGQAYLKPNGAYYYRVRAVDINGYTSGWNVVAVTNWGAYSNITISMPAPYPPSVPQIRSITNNIREDIWVNGVLVSNYLHAADYVVNLSTSTSGAGVSFYEVQEALNPSNFVTGQGITLDLPHYPDTNAFLPGTSVLYTNPASQGYQETNGTHYYRVRAVDINGFTSAWNVASATNWTAYSNRVVNLPQPVPPTPPLITSIRPDVVRTVFSNGVPLVYTTKCDYAVNISTSAAGAGINIYEVQETSNPTNFLTVDTAGYPFAWYGMSNPPVRIIAPHFPDTSLFVPGTTTPFTNPAVQFFTKANGTNFYRVCAHDINGYRSAWNVAYSPTSVYPSYVVNVLQPSPPIPPAVTTNGIQNLDGSLILSFPASVSGEPILGYEIELSTDPAFATTNAATYSLVPSAVFDGLPVGTYYIRTRAEDWNGIKSAWSTPQSFTLTMPVISGVSISQVSNDSAVVSWTTDVPSSTEVERRGMYKVFQTWRDPDTFVQGVLYAPAEAYGSAITTNDVETDLQQFKTNNINLINLYNLGWDELQQHGNVEDYIFKRAGELGIKIVVRFETYNKYHSDQPAVGDNVPSKHFAYRPEDADWIINYYTATTPVLGTNGYAARYPGSIKYLVINMPFDDPDLRRQDGIGLDDFPDKDRQRSYVAAFYSKLKAADPIHPVYVNLGFGGQDRDPHFGVADLVDGISEHVYTVRLDYYTRCYGYIPGAADADYLLMNQDVYDYYLEKMFALNNISSNGRPVIIDQTGYCEINDFTTGLVKDKNAKARACNLLRDYLAEHPHLPNGWTYFMAFDKFNEGGEQATWGLIDRLNQFVDFFDTTTTNWAIQSGAWSVATGVYASAGSTNDTTLTVFGQKKGTIEAAFNSGHAAQTNVYIVFSYLNATNYRYAGYDSAAARWLIAEVSNGVTTVLASKNATNAGAVVVAPDTEYALRVVVNFNSVRLDVGLTRKIAEYTFPSFTQGRIGLMTRGSPIAFPSFKIFGRVYQPQQVTQHNYKLNTMFPGTIYRIRALSGGAASSYTDFSTAPDAPTPPRPAIKVITPAYGNVATDGVYDISWKAADPMDDAYIDLYYSRFERASVYNNENPSNHYEAVLIASGIKAVDGVVDHHAWDPSGVMPGNYYILAKIYRPGSGQPDEYDYSSGQIVLSTRQVPAIRTSATNIVIDGRLIESAWTNAQARTYAKAGFGTTQTVARIKLLWNDINLYIGYDVDDPELASGDSLNNSDGVFCFINNGRPSLNFLDITGRQWLMDPNGSDPDRPKGSFAAITNRPGGYTAEMLVRWDSLRVIPSLGDIVPADFKVVDRTAAGQVQHVSFDPNNDDWLAGRTMKLVQDESGFPPASSYNIGIDNGSDADLDQAGYDAVFYADRMDSIQFPKELNTTWWTNQDIVITAPPASLTNGLTLLLDPTWCDGAGALNVRVQVGHGGVFSTAGTLQVGCGSASILAIPASFLAAGEDTIRLQVMSGTLGTTVVIWDRIAILGGGAGGATTVALGTRNQSDAEFAQTGYNANFNVNTMPVSQLAKELNSSWWTTQNLLLDASAIDDAQGLVLILDPSWSDGSGYLDIEIAVSNATGTATAAVVSVNAETRGIALVSPQILAAGANTIRLRSLGGSGGTTVVVWDQIRIEPPVLGNNSALGTVNGSDAEFAPANYDHTFLAGNMVAADLTKELNVSWWNWQDIGVILDAAAASSGIGLTLDPSWSDGAGLLNVEIGLDSGSDVTPLRVVGVNASTTGRFVLPAGLLRNGLQRITLAASSGSGGTTVATWDQVKVQPSSQVLLGTHNGSDAEFAQGSYAPVFNADVSGVASFPKELNTTWWRTQTVTRTISDADLVAQGMSVVLDPSWSDGSGLLTVEVGVQGTGYVAVGTASVNANTRGIVNVPAAQLASGANTFVLRALQGSNGTTVAVWDQVRFESRVTVAGVWLGADDGSDADLASGDYDSVFLAGHQVASEFPKELNTTWWNAQQVAIDLDAAKAAAGLAVTLDAAWNDGAGALTVEVSVDKGSGFVVAGTAAVNAATPGTVSIGPSLLAAGPNRIRLKALAGTGGTSVVTWDRVWIQ